MFSIILSDKILITNLMHAVDANMSEEKVLFILEDKLTTIYDAVIGIYSVATKPKTTKM